MINNVGYKVMPIDRIYGVNNRLKKRSITSDSSKLSDEKIICVYICGMGYLRLLNQY